MQRSPRNVPATQRSATSTTIAVATFHHCHVHPTIDHVRYYHVPPRDAHHATPTTQRPATSTPRPLQRSQLPHVHHCNVVACYFSTCNGPPIHLTNHHGHHDHHGHLHLPKHPPLHHLVLNHAPPHLLPKYLLPVGVLPIPSLATGALWRVGRVGSSFPAPTMCVFLLGVVIDKVDNVGVCFNELVAGFDSNFTADGIDDFAG